VQFSYTDILLARKKWREFKRISRTETGWHPDRKQLLKIGPPLNFFLDKHLSLKYGSGHPLKILRNKG
jgi:hypothetical protein